MRSRKVVGYAISRRIDTPLALAALQSAVQSRKPPPGCIHHTDRGSQYASETYRRALKEAGLRGSMSSPGNPYHNAQAESFMKTLKTEGVYIAGYETFADVANRLPRFIEKVYNARRLHSALGYPSTKRIRITTRPAGRLVLTPSGPVHGAHSTPAPLRTNKCLHFCQKDWKAVSAIKSMASAKTAAKKATVVVSPGLPRVT